MKKQNILLLVLLLTIFFSACEDWLNVQPEDGLVRQDYWKTETHVKDAVIGIYSSMIENDNFIWTLFRWGELRSDMIANGVGASNTIKEQIEGLYLPTHEITDWTLVYRTINLCNTVLQFAKDAQKNDITFEYDSLKAYEAEALGIRALMYFYLVRTFGEVPLKLDASYKDDQDYFLPKSTQDVILNRIIADLDTADKYAVLTYGNNDFDKGRITKYSIWAMKADVYLWTDQYEKCNEYCDKIINSNNFGLIAGDENWFQTLYYQGNSNEGIFELQYSVNKLNQTFYRNFSPTTSAQQVKASALVYLYYFMPDELDPTINDLRQNGGSINVSNMSIWKYIGGPLIGAQKDISEAYSHWIFYRFADIKLLKAEALAQLGGRWDEVFKEIDDIRDRSNAISTTAFQGDSTSTLDVTRYILDERAREMAFEGKRWFDILRICKRNNYAMLNDLIDIVTRNVSPIKITTVLNRYRDVRSHYLPINYDEILRNYNLTQNTFYE